MILREADQLEALLALAIERRKTVPEIGAIKLLSAEETCQRIPLLKAQPAVWITGGGRLDGRKYLAHLEKRLQKEGIKIIRAAANVTDKENSWQVTTHDHNRTFDAIAICNGPKMNALLEPIGLSVDIRPQKGQLLTFQTNYQATEGWPVAMLNGESDLIPLPDSRILIGATHENEPGFDLKPTSSAFAILKKKTLPFLAETDFFEEKRARYRVGTRAYTSDFAPFFDTLTNFPEAVVASGLGSSGLTTGPYIGYLLADYFNKGNKNWQQYQKPLDNYVQKI